jgi:hypothetical protein
MLPSAGQGWIAKKAKHVIWRNTGQAYVKVTLRKRRHGIERSEAGTLLDA